MSLICSPRLTESDKEHWKRWLAYDALHSHNNAYEWHLSRTLDVIQEFIARKERYFVALSWGKDSVCLAHLFQQFGAVCKYVYVRNLAREPEGNLAVRDAFLSRFPLNYEEISYNYANADETYYDKHGKPCKWQHILQELHEKYGCHVTGIRYDESAKRRRRFNYFGLETENSFAPFRYFDSKDVFAYMLINDLPVHPNYAMTGGGRWDKYRIRVAAIGNREGDGMGRTQWEREYYPDILNRLR